MGDSGSRRSTLVSRLPIFRRSISRRHDSLPSSPSSINTVGVHSSSPSSTNSSSGSTGKRRSIFRTPSISFHNKKGSEQKSELASQNVSISNGVQSTLNNFQKPSLDEHVKSRGRHSVGFGSSRSKKITRSLTEDFEKGKEPSTNKNVFINCIRSGKNEGDDSGFIEEQSRQSIKESSRKLLPKSFSSHYRFSKPVPQSQSVSCVQQSGCLLEIKPYVESDPVTVKSSPSCSAEITECAGSSLQSPQLSADLTTVQTPSEFLAFTEDSFSEVDVVPSSGNTAPHTENFDNNTSTSQIFLSPVVAYVRKIDHVESTSLSAVISPVNHTSFCSTESNTLPKNTAANQTQVLLQATELPVKEAGHIGEINSADAQLKTCALHHGEKTVECSPKASGLCGDQHEITLSECIREKIPVTESKIIPSSFESRSFKTHHSKVNLASSFSPYREGRVIEKRLRSSSESNAGSSRTILKPKDGNTEDLHSLRKQRAGSSSSKMNSLLMRRLKSVIKRLELLELKVTIKVNKNATEKQNHFFASDFTTEGGMELGLARLLLDSSMSELQQYYSSSLYNMLGTATRSCAGTLDCLAICGEASMQQAMGASHLNKDVFANTAHQCPRGVTTGAPTNAGLKNKQLRRTSIKPGMPENSLAVEIEPVPSL
ncbi:hypothetical protein UY3_00236 [Chelonia mydas]|uniref:Serine-rich coiled-coil domain-containing protein 1 n=1 Tax=Chelonia mydas TaxID=8469 RepID=M7C2T8_CHEMY|nr:hypothetical protein UY3_00236 [Chelonia mydas]